MKKQLFFSLTFALAGIAVHAQQAFVSTGGTADIGSESITYVVGQMTNQSSNQLHFGVLQVFDMSGEILGIDNPEGVDFSIYPNPTTQFLKVRYSGGKPLSLTYKFFDLQGREVVSGTMQGDEPSIDVTRLANHQYQLMVFSRNQLIKTFKIVKK
ncbi:MAG: T9SS type A sorting domain-containing protein [Bacteroidota bacterium]